MSEHMGVRIEAWPLAADHTRIWVLSGKDAWRSGRLPADSTVHGELKLLIDQHDIGFPILGEYEVTPFPRVTVNHSTSWRQGGPNILLTYAVVFDCGEHVQDTFLFAEPVDVELHDHPYVGNPRPHDPAGPPDPRHIDVLFHAIRHLRFLYDTDSDARAALGLTWRRHLEPFRPVLAGLYE